MDKLEQIENEIDRVVNGYCTQTGGTMNKEYRFPEPIRFVNWNNLIPEMLGVWQHVDITYDLKTGETVVRVVVEEQ